MENKNLETMVAENVVVEDAVVENPVVENAVVETAKNVELSKVLESYYVVVKDGNVTSNIGYVKQILQQKCDELTNMIYAGSKKDQLAMIKKDKAEVNTFKDAVGKQKTSVRNSLLEPFADFEKEANEAIELAKRTYDHLNKSAAAIEEEFREEKRVTIREFYDSIKEPVGDYADDLYRMIYQTSWENASASLTKTKKELQEKVDTYVTGMNTLTMMMCEEDIKETAVALFKKNLDIAVAMQHIATETKTRAEAKAREEARIAAEKARIEAEAQAAIEAERRRAEEERQAAIEAERRRAEEEKQAELIAERKRLEEEAAEREAAAIEAARSEAIQREEKAKQMDADAEMAVSMENQNNSVVKKANDNSRICVEFLSEDWKALKEYCDLHAIFYSVK